ncbi:hypothetical protein D3C81_1987940 [compost metagenome]
MRSDARLPASSPSSMASVSVPRPVPCKVEEVDSQSARPASRKLVPTPAKRKKGERSERLRASMAIPRLW